MKARSLIIPFYDRDVYLIPSKIENIRDIGFEGEVLFIDDRADKSLELDFQGFNCLSYEGNKNLFYARRYGVLHSKGDYIQFSDMDDSILKVDFNPEDCDIVKYNATFDKGSALPLPCSKPVCLKNLTDSMRSALAVNLRAGVWSFIYKKDLLLKFYEDYPAFEGFFRYEDFFLNFGLLDYIRSFKFDPQTIYSYNTHADGLFKDAFDFCVANLKEGIGKEKFIKLIGCLKLNSEL